MEANREKKSKLYVSTEGGVNEGESVAERSKALPQLKKASSTILPRYKRARAASKQRKAKRVLRILTQVCLLLAALLWMGQIILRLTGKIENNTEEKVIILEKELIKLEGKIENHTNSKEKVIMLEKELKKLEVKTDGSQKFKKQIEEKVVMLEKELKKLEVKTDGSQAKELIKQIEEKVEMLEKEVKTDGSQARKLRKQIEKKVAMLEKELKKLEVKIDGLDKSLTEFKDMGLLSKEEFEIFRDELAKKLDRSDSDVHLDQIMSFARDLVKKEIERHAADGLGRVDYALASGGARVVSHSKPHGFQGVNGWLHTFRIGNGVHPSAQKMLEPSYGEPGQCFPLQGSSGFVEIRLRTGIIPKAVTLEHVSKSVAYDRSSAPKDCRVSAWFESDDNDDPSSQAKVYRLSEFSYDLEKSNVQTFNIETAHELGVVVNKVRLDFTSNHGSSDHTCIYRFRVHGYEPSSLVPISSNLMAL